MNAGTPASPVRVCNFFLPKSTAGLYGKRRSPGSSLLLISPIFLPSLLHYINVACRSCPNFFGLATLHRGNNLERNERIWGLQILVVDCVVDKLSYLCSRTTGHGT